MEVIFNENQKVPIKMWLDNIEDGALEQAYNLSKLPFAFKHIALMPDCHQGYGMPIGGVLATTDRIIIVNAVGKDIGCGVRAIKTNLTVEEFMPNRDKVLNQIQRDIPTGFSHNKIAYSSSIFEDMPETPVLNQEIESARLQLGTLGGGNHFIEIQKDEENNIWIMLHSGSRNLGAKVADYYDKMATKLNEQWYSSVSSKVQLSFLPLDTPEGKEYFNTMNFCLTFSKENRRIMMDRITDTLIKYFNHVEILKEIDIQHNYAAMENHFGQNVMVHRKGAVKAVGDVIIPGSMGSNSYICKGLENPQSFKSCSHGAGRVMGRKEAQRQIPVEKVILEMREKDIRLFKPKKNDVSEECRQAYKDIDTVMENQKELVEAVVKLTPIGVIKA